MAPDDALPMRKNRRHDMDDDDTIIDTSLAPSFARQGIAFLAMSIRLESGDDAFRLRRAKELAAELVALFKADPA